MTNKKLHKDKSFYTIKNVHTKTNKGTIYENDYVTIVQNNEFLDETPLFRNSNFIFNIKTNENGKKRHVKNNWVGDVWTKENLGEDKINEDSKINLKPNYNSLKDFAYFGSAVELIKNTVRDIITRFPGGLYYYNDKDICPQVKINKEVYYFISNECEIDCWSDNVSFIEEGENPLRYLSYSYTEYSLSTKPNIKITSNCLDSIIGEVKIGNHNLKIYKDNNGHNHLVTSNSGLTGTIIEPKSDIINKFWEELDDFGHILLNRNTLPLYTAIFETPYSNEDGYFYRMKSYTWPTINGTNTPDLTTQKFKGYINSLMMLAEFHDEYDSDNMWRMMTHEAIKNLDWTLTSKDETLDEIDSTRMRALIQIQGRQFDDIKRYADNVKYTNSVSYNEQNNVPDYFLSDIVDIKGWETKNVAPFSGNIGEIKYQDTTIVTSGKTQGYINSNFMRYLSLSSDYISSMKGTKKSIESVLGLFGFNSDEYEITEYVATVSGPLDYDDAVCQRIKFDYVNADEHVNFMDGYPVTLIENGDNFDLYPWYDSRQTYEGDFYYQCKGGWGRREKININRQDLTNITEIYDDTLYSETEPYMLFANTLNDLKLFPNYKIKNGVICYVSDISNIKKEYIKGNNESLNYSHYFILRNKSLSTRLGYVSESKYQCYGWYNIKINEYNSNNTLTEEGKKVLYLESLNSNYKGNNPHTGKGNYDFGYDYLHKYAHLFREAVDDGRCDNLSESEKQTIRNYGFNFNNILPYTDGKCFDYIDKEIDSLKTINLKNVTILFKTNNSEIKNYINDIVIPYIENVIPSTVLIEYLFGNETSIINDWINNIRTVTMNSPKPADIITSDIITWVESEIK